MTSGIASLECATTGVIFKATLKKPHLSIVSPTSLDRRQLGAVGKALYQADVYISGRRSTIARIPRSSRSSRPGAARGNNYKMYRLRFLGAPRISILRLCEPDIEQTPAQPLSISIRTWRLQPQAAGLAPSPDDLRGPGGHLLRHRPAIDEILPGEGKVPLGPQRRRHGRQLARADNSASSSTTCLHPVVLRERPPPDSPWLLPMANADAPNENLMESGSSVFWLTDPQKAWKLASIQKRPILAQFYAPRIPTYANLKSITPNDEETRPSSIASCS
jgi:hypothetical protein